MDEDVIEVRYTIKNPGKDTLDRSENVKDTLCDVFDAIEYESLRPYIRDLRYASTTMECPDFLIIKFVNKNDIETFTMARTIGEAIGDCVTKTSIGGLEVDNFFIGLKVGIRMTKTQRDNIGEKLLPDFRRQLDLVDSIDLPDGTVFYIRSRSTKAIRRMWNPEPVALSGFELELEEVFGRNEDPQRVLMQEINVPTYSQVSLA